MVWISRQHHLKKTWLVNGWRNVRVTDELPPFKHVQSIDNYSRARQLYLQIYAIKDT